MWVMRTDVCTMDQSLEPLLVNWRDNRTSEDDFGDFCNRVDVKALSEFSAAYISIA